MPEHEPRARYCTLIVGIPVSELRDDLTCPACDAEIRLMMLDPDVEVLAPPAHLMVTESSDPVQGDAKLPGNSAHESTVRESHMMAECSRMGIRSSQGDQR